MRLPSFAFAITAVLLSLAALADPGPVALRPYASGLAAPVEIVHANDGTNRLFVVEQAGVIRVVRDGVVSPVPFMDITSSVQSGGEQGLLGLAFHPQYRTNGVFFVYHTVPPANTAAGGNDLVLARYTCCVSSDPDRADPSSRMEILRIPHPAFTNHNGGKIAFGGGGGSALYIAVGDGGGGGDPNNNAQDLSTLLGKLLRIDVDAPPLAPYAIPAGNPFRNTPGARPEIFAYGLRNPWRFSFDRLTLDAFIGDVGQGQREEVDFLVNGSMGGFNYGWDLFEGTACHEPPTGCSLAGHVPPIIEYGRGAGGGFSVTGGYRYRGRSFPELYGHYVYGDFGSGRIWAALPGDSSNLWNPWVTTEVANLPNVTTFGEDEQGELYAASYGGSIVRLSAPDADGDGMSDAFEQTHFGSPTAGDAFTDSDGDGIPNLHEYRERRNPLVKDNDVFNVGRLFAMQQYRDFLSREGDEAGIGFWTARLDSMLLQRGDVVQFFFDSAEFQGVVAPVARLYFAFFLRFPDHAGLQYWVGRFRGGEPLASIAGFFAASQEFVQRYGSLSNAQFVTLVYNNVLGRAPDPEGQAFWQGRLDSGAMTRGEVMLAFSESAEHRALSFNEIYVTMAYLAMLRREPDAGGFSYWVDYMDNGNSPQALIHGFLAAQEYRARFLQ